MKRTKNEFIKGLCAAFAVSVIIAFGLWCMTLTDAKIRHSAFSSYPPAVSAQRQDENTFTVSLGSKKLNIDISKQDKLISSAQTLRIFIPAPIRLFAESGIFSCLICSWGINQSGVFTE